MTETRDRVGAWLGILTFLGGVGLLLLTFSIAYRMFSTPPEQVLSLRPGQTMDLNETGRAGFMLVFRMLMLLVMSVVGSVIANRGIKLYASGRGQSGPPKANGEESAAA